MYTYKSQFTTSPKGGYSARGREQADPSSSVTSPPYLGGALAAAQSWPRGATAPLLDGLGGGGSTGGGPGGGARRTDDAVAPQRRRPFSIFQFPLPEVFLLSPVGFETKF